MVPEDELHWAEIRLPFDLETEIPEEYTGMYGDRMFSTADDILQGAPVLAYSLTHHPSEDRQGGRRRSVHAGELKDRLGPLGVTHAGEVDSPRHLL